MDSRDTVTAGRRFVSQIWRDLYEETGFTFYEEYISHHSDGRLYLNPFRAYLRNLRLIGEDLTSKNISSLVSRCRYQALQVPNTGGLVESRKYEGLLDEEEGVGLLKFLRHSSDDVAMKLLFIEISDRGDPSSCFFDVLGLGLKIDPRAFMSFITRKASHPPFGHSTFPKVPWRHETPGLSKWVESQPLRPTFVTVGPFMLYYTDEVSPPVLLILGYVDYIKTDTEYYNPRNCTGFGLNIVEPLPFSRNRVEPFENTCGWPGLMVTLLKWGIQQNSNRNEQQGNLSLIWISAFGQFQLEYLKWYCHLIRPSCLLAMSREDTSASKGLEEYERAQLEYYRYHIRRVSEDTHDGFIQFHRLASRILREGFEKNRCLQNLQADLDEALSRCSRLVAEIKEYLQLHVGELALQDSKRSIALSNVQMKEAKRGMTMNLETCIWLTFSSQNR